MRLGNRSNLRSLRSLRSVRSNLFPFHSILFLLQSAKALLVYTLSDNYWPNGLWLHK